MSATYATFALSLPSGRCVRVRRPDAPACLGRDRLLLPLVSLAAATCVRDDGEPKAPPGPFDAIRQYVTLALASPRMPEDITFEDLPFSDALAIYHWAVLGVGDTSAPEDWPYRATDFAPLVTGEGALFLDMLCNRYHQRPSVCMGIDDAPFALDLDMAIAYRGLRRDADGMDGEMEVPDVFGDLHRVPRQWLAQCDAPQGSRVVDMDTVAKTHGPGTVSIGGYGGDGVLAPQPTPGSLERARY